MHSLPLAQNTVTIPNTLLHSVVPSQFLFDCLLQRFIFRLNAIQSLSATCHRRPPTVTTSKPAAWGIAHSATFQMHILNASNSSGNRSLCILSALLQKHCTWTSITIISIITDCELFGNSCYNDNHKICNNSRWNCNCSLALNAFKWWFRTTIMISTFKSHSVGGVLKVSFEWIEETCCGERADTKNRDSSEVGRANHDDTTLLSCKNWERCLQIVRVVGRFNYISALNY